MGAPNSNNSRLIVQQTAISLGTDGTINSTNKSAADESNNNLVKLLKNDQGQILQGKNIIGKIKIIKDKSLLK